MVEIIKADKTHKDVVLKLLDEFLIVCTKLKYDKDEVSTDAKEKGGPVFDEVIDSKDSAIFLAKEEDFIGIITVTKIPEIRRGIYCANIEEFYVTEKFWGKGIAQELMNTAIVWAKANNFNVIRLESSNKLERARKFYEKSGFKENSSFSKKI